MGQLPYLPVFPWPRVREHAPQLLSAEAQARVLEAIPEERRGIFLALAVLGARPSETARLRAIDFEPGEPCWITFPKTKNGQTKRLPVPEELAAWLERHLPRDARLRAEPLFALPYCGRGNRPSGPWYKKALEREWRAACSAFGLTSKLYEGTKHSTATEMLRRGVQERTIQGLLGHRDLRSTHRYARLADEAVVEAIRPTYGRVIKPFKNPSAGILNLEIF
jgi:integrase